MRSTSKPLAREPALVLGTNGRSYANAASIRLADRSGAASSGAGGPGPGPSRCRTAASRCRTAVLDVVS